LEYIDIDARVILKWISRERVGGVECKVLAQNRDKWRGREHGIEISGSIKCREFLD
jgi:hypothetical protein